MTRRKTKSNKGLLAFLRSQDWLTRKEPWGILLAAIGAITIIALLSTDQGTLSRAWSLFLRQVFGLGAYPVAILFLVAGIWLLIYDSMEQPPTLEWRTIVGAELLFFASLGLLHVTATSEYLALAYQGQRGGYVGWSLRQITVPLLGQTLSISLLASLIVIGLFLASGLTAARVWWRARWLWAKLGATIRSLIKQRRAKAAERAQRRRRESLERAKRARQRANQTRDTSAQGQQEPSRPQSAQASVSSAEVRTTSPSLPSLDLLLVDTKVEGGDADARHRADIIEETLAAFGIPAEVVEWHRGPVVTQFGVEPGYIERSGRNGETRRKVRVSKILSLQNDLALALAAAPVRIEAPVPGRSLVGIEVPNGEKTLVGLRGVLESRQFRQMDSALRLAMGRDVSGQAVVTDLCHMPHLLIAGATGSGKSVCLNAIIASLLFQHTADTLQLLLVDPKRVELTKYDGIPHLVSSVMTDVEKVVLALRWLNQEMEDRYKAFAQAGARDLDSYNEMALREGKPPMSYIVVVVDELADLMLASPDEVERTLCRLAQKSRATGIHLVIATQRPSVDVVTGLIKANFPARISFAVTSQVDSRVILDTPGAETLLGEGDMLFMAPDSPKPKRIQGCYISEKEIEALVSFLSRQTAPQPEEEAEEEDEEPPWDGMSLEPNPDAELLEEATELVREHQHASASFLQRQLRLGYPRAARIIDQLEERGVVGPQRSGGRSRKVFGPEGQLMDSEESDA